MLKRYTAAQRPDRRVIVWLRLRYKHRWASKRAAPHVPHVTMHACVKECDWPRTVQYVHVHTLTVYIHAPVWERLFMRSWAGVFSPSNQPLSPPVFASWSKPLPCHCSFWCSGTIEPVEVLISSSIHLHKGQASPPSPVQWAKGGKSPGRTLEVPCLQACLVRLWKSGAKAGQANGAQNNGSSNDHFSAILAHTSHCWKQL